MATGKDKFELVIEVQNKQANAAIAQTNAGLSSFEKSALQWSSRVSGGVDAMTRSTVNGMRASRVEIRRASAAAQLFGNMFGVTLPGSVRKFIGETKLLGAALSGLFKFSIYLAAGEALFTWVHRIGEKVGWWGDQTSETKRKNDELTKSIREQSKELDSYYDTLEEIKLARSAIGAPGGGNIESERAKSELAKAQQDYSALAALENKLTFKVMNNGTEIVGGARRLTSEAEKAALELAKVDDQGKTLSERVAAASQRVDIAKQLYEKAKEEGTYRRREDTERSKQYISADAVRAGGIMRESKGRTDALTTLPGFSGISPEAAQIARDSQSIANASDDAFVREWIQRRESAALSVQEQNENMIAAQMRRDGNYQGALEIELAQLERLKAGYEGNAEAIAAMEEQKKLKIIDANREIADNAKSEFERSAQSIEGFFNRVFMNAKSLADVWRQLWGQLANYAVQQISRMVAASIGGYRQAAAPAMGGGGIAAIFPAIMGGGGGGGGGAGGYAGIGTPPFVPSTSGGGGFGSLFNSGFLSNLGTNFVNFAMSPLGALAGVGMFAAGAKRGGASGLALSAGGGWLGGAGIGSMIAGPYGAAIGAAVGLGAGLISGIVGLFRKSPEEKLKEKIRSAYGVNIRDKGVLQQILSLAQRFGGNLDMTIRHREVVELISLYAQTTNQTMRGAPKQMTSATLIQSGGSLSMAQSYTNGTPTMGSLPGAGIDNVRATGATGGTVINITVPGAKEFFEKETVTVIAKNGRAVSTANASAATGNFGRTQMAATLLKPGLVTS